MNVETTIRVQTKKTRIAWLWSGTVLQRTSLRWMTGLAFDLGGPGPHAARGSGDERHNGVRS
jgi:hypothetical protein